MKRISPFWSRSVVRKRETYSCPAAHSPHLTCIVYSRQMKEVKFLAECSRVTRLVSAKQNEIDFKVSCLRVDVLQLLREWRYCFKTGWKDFRWLFYILILVFFSTSAYLYLQVSGTPTRRRPCSDAASTGRSNVKPSPGIPWRAAQRATRCR